MPYRKIVFTNEEIYHVFNRGIAKAPIFLSKRDYRRFLDLIDYYRHKDLPLSFSHYNRLPPEEKLIFREKMSKAPLLVEVLAYCLMPNHFHFLLKQLRNDGVPKMISNLENSYAKYFDIRHERTGALFQSMFKAIRMEDDNQILHVSRYIHLNPSTSYLTEFERLSFYEWSSFPYYIGEGNLMEDQFVNSDFVLKIIGGTKKYKKFVFDNASYQRELGDIKHLTLE